jgi:hypothetical protein
MGFNSAFVGLILVKEYFYVKRKYGFTKIINLIYFAHI